MTKENQEAMAMVIATLYFFVLGMYIGLQIGRGLC